MAQTFNVTITGTVITDEEAEADVTVDDIKTELKDAIDNTDVEISGIEVEPETDDDPGEVDVTANFTVTEITVTEA